MTDICIDENRLTESHIFEHVALDLAHRAIELRRNGFSGDADRLEDVLTEIGQSFSNVTGPE